MVDLVEVPLRAVGGFFQMSAQTLRAVFSRPFQRQEFIDQAWFVARVSMVPTVLVAIPFTVLVSFTINILLREIGAADPQWCRSCPRHRHAGRPHRHRADRRRRRRNRHLRGSFGPNHP